jgi:hypothetical protein
MPALILLTGALLVINHWLLEPALQLSSGVLELGWLPWMLLGLVAWFVAGRPSDG